MYKVKNVWEKEQMWRKDRREISFPATSHRDKWLYVFVLSISQKIKVSEVLFVLHYNVKYKENINTIQILQLTTRHHQNNIVPFSQCPLK